MTFSPGMSSPAMSSPDLSSLAVGGRQSEMQ